MKPYTSSSANAKLKPVIYSDLKINVIVMSACCSTENIFDVFTAVKGHKTLFNPGNLIWPNAVFADSRTGFAESQTEIETALNN